MKRLWIGIGLMTAFLVLGIFSTVSMTRIHEPISHCLERASQAALDGRFADAAALARDARLQWQEHRKCTAALADHTPMEEIDSLFAELEVYIQMDEPVHFAACCARLSTLTQAVGEAHSVSWWNLLSFLPPGQGSLPPMPGWL